MCIRDRYHVSHKVVLLPFSCNFSPREISLTIKIFINEQSRQHEECVTENQGWWKLCNIKIKFGITSINQKDSPLGLTSLMYYAVIISVNIIGPLGLYCIR